MSHLANHFAFTVKPLKTILTQKAKRLCFCPVPNFLIVSHWTWMNPIHYSLYHLRMDGKAPTTSLALLLSPASYCYSAHYGPSLSTWTTNSLISQRQVPYKCSFFVWSNNHFFVVVWFCFLSQELLSSPRYLLGCYGFRGFACPSFSN